MDTDFWTTKGRKTAFLSSSVEERAGMRSGFAQCRSAALRAAMRQVKRILVR